MRDLIVVADDKGKAQETTTLPLRVIWRCIFFKEKKGVAKIWIYNGAKIAPSDADNKKYSICHTNYNLYK